MIGVVRRDVGNVELSGDFMMEELLEVKFMIFIEFFLEEYLVYNIFWLEIYKLYGYGNEFFVMCCNNGG